MNLSLKIQQCPACLVSLTWCPGYDIKQSDGEAPVMLELWGMWHTPSLPLLPGPLCLGVIAPDRALSMSQFRPVLLYLKIDLVSHLARRRGLGKFSLSGVYYCLYYGKSINHIFYLFLDKALLITICLLLRIPFFLYVTVIQKKTTHQSEMFVRAIRLQFCVCVKQFLVESETDHLVEFVFPTFVMFVIIQILNMVEIY